MRKVGCNRAFLHLRAWGWVLLFPLFLFVTVIAAAESPSATLVTGELSETVLKQSDWWQTVQQNISEMEYEVSYQEHCLIPGGKAGYHMANRAQNLRAYFYPEGVKVVRRTESSPSWVWGYQLSGFGREGRLQPLANPSLTVERNRIDYAYGILTERYENREAGIKQSFIIAERTKGTGPLVLVATLSGNLHAHYGDDGSTVEFLHQEEAVMHYGGLVALDANGRELPARLALHGDQLHILIEDGGAVYPVTIDPFITGLSSPHGVWTAESDQANAWFGYSVATAGDVNGDGYSDVIVGAEQYDNGEAIEGRAFVYHGSAFGLSASADWTAEGNQVDARFGVSVATAGDVNGDGYDDVIIGAVCYTNGESSEGRAYVYHGSGSGLSASAAWTGESNQVGAAFGVSVATAGDVNGDGYSEVIVGASGYDNEQSGEGRAYVYHGSASGLSASAAWTAEGNQTFASFGWSVATAGDVNGDGYSEVIVGADLYDNGEGNEGRAYVYHGSSTGLTTGSADWTGESNQINGRFGNSVSTAGDVNGDGYDDVIIGADEYDNGETAEGKAYVYHGSSTGLTIGSANWTAESNQLGAWFGTSVALAGDVNGDGYSDVIVGARGYDNGEGDEGCAFVYYGSGSGLSASADWTAESNQGNAGFGWSVATGGDVNGDGYSDVIVGARDYDNGETDEGRAYVYHGSATGLSGSAAWTAECNQAGAYFGCSVATAGDVNGDGYSEVIVGADYYDNGEGDEGRAFVYHGSADGLPTTATWTAESNQANAYFGCSVATAGDVNGDGYSEVIVGAGQYDNGQTDEGCAYVWYGSASGLGPNGTPVNADWTAESNQADAYLGISVATAGDVNGDGYADVIVGAPGYSNDQSLEGGAYVYHGSASGLSASADWTAESNQADAYLGISVATAGDVNGDGYSDVIVGAFYYSNGETGEGRAYVYHGSSTGLTTGSADWTAESNQDTALFGISVATAGDVNGDGYSEVIVGADQYDNGEGNEGRAYVYHGSASGLSASAAWTAESNQAEVYFGSSVAMAGDVNGDGYGEVIVGARAYDNGQTNEGRVYLYHGSVDGLPTTATWTAESNQAGAMFGGSVAMAGDVNGDGYSEVVVGAYLYDGGETNEGRAFVYHGSADGLSATATWTAESNQGDARFGYSVATAGDVNGDGYSDVIVGADYYDNGETNEGRAFVYHGSGSGLSAAADWTAESNQGSAYFGTSAATAGDVNGDGYSDVIVGAESYDNGQSSEGLAFVWLGSAAGLGANGTPANADWTAESNQTNAYFGCSVSTAGDVNGDGYSEVIVGAESYDNGQSSEGLAFVWLGSAAGLGANGTPANADWTAESDQGSAYLGCSVATAGDVNGDGYSEVIVGAYYFDNDQANEGRAYVYHGSVTGLSGSADWIAEGNQAGAEFGLSVATAGDVNGDGYSDVIVGAVNYNNGHVDEGGAFVYHGSAAGLSPSADWTAESNQVGACLGYSVATAGDVNGDGYSEVIVSVVEYDNGEADEGGAYVYHGSAVGLSPSADWTGESNQASTYFGWSVATAGDVNGDGYSEVIVGAPYYTNGEGAEGRGYLYYGNDGGLSLRPQQRRADNSAPVAHLGMSESQESFRLAMLARSPFGRGKVKLEWEVKPLGTLFDGTGTQLSSSWTDPATTTVQVNELVSGLSPGTVYHWRERLRYHQATTPYQQYSRWVTMPWDGWQEADLRTQPTPTPTPTEPPPGIPDWQRYGL